MIQRNRLSPKVVCTALELLKARRKSLCQLSISLQLQGLQEQRRFKRKKKKSSFLQRVKRWGMYLRDELERFLLGSCESEMAFSIF